MSMRALNWICIIDEGYLYRQCARLSDERQKPQTSQISANLIEKIWPARDYCNTVKSWLVQSRYTRRCLRLSIGWQCIVYQQHT